MGKSGYRWPLQEAKNKFSQVAGEAALYGPQVVTKRGKDAVVVLSVSEYDRLRAPKADLVSFLTDSPLAGSGVELERNADPGRGVTL